MYFLSDILRWIIFDIFKYRLITIRKNISRSFPELSDNQVNAHILDFQRHFCDVIVEAIKLMTITESTLDKRINIQNQDLPNSYFKKNMNIMFYTSHLGNWEWLSFLSNKMTSPTYTFYKPLKSKYFDKLIYLIRSRFGLVPVPSDHGYRTVIENVKNDKQAGYCLIGDQSPTLDKSSKIWLKFLNQETAFFTGPAQIAKKNRQVILFPAMRKKDRGNYRIEYLLISDPSSNDSIDDIVTQYGMILENEIRQCPALWLWSHNRWKLKAAD